MAIWQMANESRVFAACATIHVVSFRLPLFTYTLLIIFKVPSFISLSSSIMSLKTVAIPLSYQNSNLLSIVDGH